MLPPYRMYTLVLGSGGLRSGDSLLKLSVTLIIVMVLIFVYFLGYYLSLAVVENRANLPLQYYYKSNTNMQSVNISCLQCI
jgi:hypothetical protein